LKKIVLTQGKFALVDDNDFEQLNQFKWYAQKGGNLFYAARRDNLQEWKVVLMHREIMKAPKRMDVDHIDRDSLNNQRSNLRICNRSQNSMNSVHTKGMSKYKGVCWDKNRKKWKAEIAQSYKRIHIGRYDSEVVAAKAYDAKAVELFGEYARTNF